MSMTESDVQNLQRLQASQRGWRLFRNNKGVLPDANGRPVRFGLANDSKAESDEIASADLIGIAPVIVTQDMVGKLVGVFVSVECKAEGVTRVPKAQRKWRDLIRAMGGYAIITNGKQEL